MVRDGIYLGGGIIVAAAILGWLAGPVYALAPLPLAAFFLWFFRDPDRSVPATPGAIVSPADGKVTHVFSVQLEGSTRPRISIFLNVFNVHVNRSPMAGVIRRVEYQKGKFGNAMGALSADANEQNIVTVEGDGAVIVFKQIAGLLARRIVFNKKVGDRVERGERVGLIKFGSRVDVVFPVDAQLLVRVGDHVSGGSSVIAQMPLPAGAAPPAATQSGERS